MKKIILTIVAVLCIAGAFTGCASDNTPETTTTTSAKGETTTVTTVTDPTTTIKGDSTTNGKTTNKVQENASELASDVGEGARCV